jgi:hypothetical protein
MSTFVTVDLSDRQKLIALRQDVDIVMSMLADRVSLPCDDEFYDDIIYKLDTVSASLFQSLIETRNMLVEAIDDLSE